MISKLHYITQDLPHKTHQQLAMAACEGGANWVQLRMKNKDPDELKEIAIEVQAICKMFGAKFIINDHVQLAKELHSDGVHVGKEDMAPALVREILGKDCIIGGTANNWEDIQRLHEQGVDYIGLGPFRFTSTKQKLSPILGIEGYRHLLSLCDANAMTIPIVAIGGIRENDVAEILKTGVHGIALAGAINESQTPQTTTKRFCRMLYSG